MLLSEATFKLTFILNKLKKNESYFQLNDQGQKTLSKKGILIIPNFLPNSEFLDVYKECRDYADKIDQTNPLTAHKKSKAILKDGAGADYYDGATVNRQLDINQENTPITWQLCNNKKLIKSLKKMTGLTKKPSFKICQNIHGDENVAHDSQKDLHKDTFHNTYKLWYYMEAVTIDSGPFNYIPTSNRLTLRRLWWEYRKSIAHSKTNQGGAFRVSDIEKKEMNLPPLESISVEPNTLILANTRGFHCRGEASSDVRRFSLYCPMRPLAFFSFFSAITVSATLLGQGM